MLSSFFSSVGISVEYAFVGMFHQTGCGASEKRKEEAFFAARRLLNRKRDARFCISQYREKAYGGHKRPFRPVDDGCGNESVNSRRIEGTRDGKAAYFFKNWLAGLVSVLSSALF